MTHTKVRGGETRQLTDTLSFDDLAKHDMLVVQVGSLYSGDEELGSIGVGAGVCHRQEERFVMFPGERLICELFSVDRLSPGPVSGGKITTLDHEPAQGDIYNRGI